MRPSLLEYLICPPCGTGLDLISRESHGDQIMEGGLRCGLCGKEYPIVRGVPRFAGSRGGDRTATAFGWQWKHFREMGGHHERQFLDWIAPAGRASFRDRVVLEGGCGKGRHTVLAARYGARAVIGLDLSEAVDVAFDNTREQPAAHIIQADMLSLPVSPGICDYVFSVGVLHHLPEPREGFLSLSRALRPGGAISIWVYGAENNRWIARVVSPVRRAVTSRMPPPVLYGVSFILSRPLWVLLKTLYRPARSRWPARLQSRLFYRGYLSYISGFPLREIHSIVHDHLGAPVAHYLCRGEVETWYRLVDARDVTIAWHNENSWRGHGRPERPGLGDEARAGGGGP